MDEPRTLLRVGGDRDMTIITAAELGNWLGITDAQDDMLLGVAATAANQAVTDYCDRDFGKTPLASPTTRAFRPRHSTLCIVDDFWETTALIVKTDDGLTGTYTTTWTTGTDYVLEPANGLVHGQAWPYSKIRAVGGRTFPCGSDRPTVQVTAVGMGIGPAGGEASGAHQTGRLFRRKDSPEGIIGGFQDFTAVRLSSREDPDIVMLLQPFRTTDAAILVR